MQLVRHRHLVASSLSLAQPIQRPSARLTQNYQNAPSHAASLSHHVNFRSTHAPTHAVRQLRLSSDLSSLRSAAEHFRNTFNLPLPTGRVQDLTNDDIGNVKILHGFLGPRSDISKGISFLPLLSTDLAHSVQIISAPSAANDEEHEIHRKLKGLNAHIPVLVTGTVQKKVKPKQPSHASDFGRVEDVEIKLGDVVPLNDFNTEIDFQPTSNIPPDFRYLQIRQDASIRAALQFRAKVINTCRDYLGKENDFLDVETPLLFRSTPEGAREFLVPTRRKGEAYALPQSPQQYKQILMASGISKYFQIARCFRDEDLRADRQPEFTQLDLEAAFTTSQQIMDYIEGLVRKLWKSCLEVDLPSGPFRVLTYESAISNYGSDKPDTRFGMEINHIGHLIPADLTTKIGPNVDPFVECFKLSGILEPADARKFISEFMDTPQAETFNKNPDGQPGIFIYDTRKPLGGLQPFGFEAAEHLEELLELEEGDIVFIQARNKERPVGGSTPVGNLRLAIHRFAVQRGILDQQKGWDFLWVNHFPLFTVEDSEYTGQGGHAGFSSTHHPFTAPATIEDLDLLESDPRAAKADHYDLVLNGVELGGGSRRIHDAQVQEYILRHVLKMEDQGVENFSHLLKALRAGCPPHAGIALGLDRLCAVMLGRESIRDVLAFPKSGKGEDLLVRSPSKVTPQQLQTYHLELKA